MGTKVESVLKINNEEVKEVCEINSLRFYMANDSDSVYIANPKGEVIAQLVCGMSQATGFVSGIKDMAKDKFVFGGEW